MKNIKFVIIILLLTGLCTCKDSFNDAIEGELVKIKSTSVSGNVYSGSIQVSGNPQSMIEGETVQVSIKLTKIPANDVTVTVKSSDSLVLTVNDSVETELIFTPSNFSVEQLVNLVAVHDNDINNASGEISVTSSGVSPVEFTVNVTEDDAVNISITGDSIVEEGSSIQLGVSLTYKPNANVVVALVSSDTSAVTVGTANLTFTPANYGDVQNVTISGVEDSDCVEEIITVTGSASGLSNAEHNITTGENDFMAIADTGQTVSYTDTWGEDHDYVDIPNARSYTGPTQNTTYTNDYTTIDDITELIWKTCSEGQTGADCTDDSALQYTWENAKIQCLSLNVENTGVGYAGRTDWRLATIEELGTLLDYGKLNPAIEEVYFPETMSSNYWSSSTYIDNSSKAWIVILSHGYMHNISNTNNCYVRCVSGP